MKEGEYIRKKRLEQRMGLREFCRRSGQDPSNWSKIESGKRKCSYADLIIAAEVLSISIERLLELLRANEILYRAENMRQMAQAMIDAIVSD